MSSSKEDFKKDETIIALKSSLHLLETRFKTVVYEIKKSKQVIQEKDKAINQLLADRKSSETIARLTTACGQHEQQRLQDKKEIESLKNQILNLNLNQFIDKTTQTQTVQSLDVSTQTEVLSESKVMAVVTPTSHFLLQDDKDVEKQEKKRKSKFKPQLTPGVSPTETSRIKEMETIRQLTRGSKTASNTFQTNDEALSTDISVSNKPLIPPSTSTPEVNMVYVRNVLSQFVKTTDKKQQKIMMVALTTALGIKT